MAYTETMGSRRQVKTNRKWQFVELGVMLNADSDGPSVQDKPTADGGLTTATAIGDFRCIKVQEDREALPGLIMITSIFEKFITYS